MGGTSGSNLDGIGATEIGCLGRLHRCAILRVATSFRILAKVRGSFWKTINGGKSEAFSSRTNINTSDIVLFIAAVSHINKCQITSRSTHFFLSFPKCSDNQHHDRLISMTSHLHQTPASVLNSRRRDPMTFIDWLSFLFLQDAWTATKTK